MQDLEHKLQEASGARFRMIATDGVFSMDGVIANLPEIFALARKYDCMVLVDDSHAVGFVGKDGRGTPEFFGLDGDERLILSGTLGKALGGGSGGYIAGSRDVISLLRQRSRPYLFSNSLAPPVVAASLEALRLVRESPHLRNKLHENAGWFRERLTGLGFDLKGDGHPIIPVMTYDSNVSQRFAELLMDNGVYVISFSYPVVPREKARVRTQVSASHEIEDLAFAADMFHKAGQICGLLSQ
jgi:glycine C-acetyltransferase